MNFQISGVPETIDAIETAIAEFQAEVGGLIQDAGKEAEGIAVSLAAVRSGKMKGAIYYTPIGILESQVISPVYYSPFVDLGSTHHYKYAGTIVIEAQPFMTPAYDTASEHLLSNIKAL
jgi:hypothetical protein